MSETLVTAKVGDTPPKSKEDKIKEFPTIKCFYCKGIGAIIVNSGGWMSSRGCQYCHSHGILRLTNTNIPFAACHE